MLSREKPVGVFTRHSSLRTRDEKTEVQHLGFFFSRPALAHVPLVD